MYRLACAASPRVLGIETETGDWRLDAFIAHVRTCRTCAALQRQITTAVYDDLIAGKSITTRQAAARLRVSPRRVLALIATGRLRALRVGRQWLIDPTELRTVRGRPPGRPRRQ